MSTAVLIAVVVGAVFTFDYLEKIMSTQSDLAIALGVIKDKVTSIGKKVDDLRIALVAAGDSVKPEVSAAFDNLAAEVDAVGAK